jgi:predicted dehydrogenase
VRPVGIGLTGLGRWGRNYVKTLLALPECRLVAMADADKTVCDRLSAETGIPVCESADELLSEPAVEAVVIATPEHTHCALASAALAAGRDVLVEKPMTLTAAEAEVLVRQAEDKNRVLAVGHTAVYATDIDSLRIRLDTIPRTAERLVRAERTSSGPSSHSSLASAAPVGQCAARDSAILFDLCPHDIALAVLLFGTPAAARARSNGKNVEYEVKFKGDQLLNGQAEWREPPHVRRFEVGGARSALNDETGGRGSHAIRETPLGRQCLDFVECCRTRRQPLSSGRVGLAVMRCISALVLSCADRGAWVQLNSELRMSNDKCRVPDSGLRPSELGVRT